MKNFQLSAVARAMAALPLAARQATPFQLHQADPAGATVDAEAIRAELAKIGQSVKEQGERALAEARKTGEVSAEAKQKVDEVLVKQGELQARLLEVEQKMARNAGVERAIAQTVGQQFVADPKYAEWLKAGGMRSAQSGYIFQLMAAIVSTSDAGPTTVGVPPDVRPGIVGIPERRMTVRDLITPGRTDSNLVQYVRETGFTNNAAVVTEGAQKPESTITYSLEQAAVATIAHFIKSSKQILDDFAQLQSNIDGRLRYGLAYVEEQQILKGSGTGNNLNGIYTQATAYSLPSGATAPSPETKIDRLRLMLLQAELAEFPSTGIVLHPTDWASIELLKDSTGGYIFANPQNLAQAALWGRPVVSTQAMTVDTALVGAFKLGAQLFDRELSNVVIATENQDDFIKNMVTIRAEERLALAVYRPEAFIKDTNLPA